MPCSFLCDSDRMQVLALTPDRDLAYQIAEATRGTAQCYPAIHIDAALTILATRKPEIALVDLETPYPGGLVAASKIINLSLQHKHSIHIILMAKRAEPGLIEKARQQGVNDFLLLPFQPETLIQKLAVRSVPGPGSG